MKKVISLLMIMVILTGCSSKDEDVEKNVDDILETGTTSDSATINAHLNENISSYDTKSWNYCETKYGFYASEFGEILYMDKEAGKKMTVCSIPNCKHAKMHYDDDELEAGKVQCDGYVWCNNQVCVYNGKILLDYNNIKEDKNQIIMEDLDGSNKEVLINDIMPEDYEKIDNPSGSLGWSLYNDIIYVFTSKCYYENREKINSICLEKFDAKTGERIGRIFKRDYNDDSDVATASGMYVFEDSIYIDLMTDIDIGDGQAYEDGFRICSKKILKVNLSTGEANFVPFSDDYNMTSYGLKDDKMVCLSKNSSLTMVNIETKEVYFDIPIEDLKSGGHNIYSVNILKEYIIVRIEGEYTKGDDKYVSKLMFYDMEGKFVDEVYTKKVLNPKLANENIIMLTNGSQTYAYINTEEIGTGEINIKEFEK